MQCFAGYYDIKYGHLLEGEKQMGVIINNYTFYTMITINNEYHCLIITLTLCKHRVPLTNNCLQYTAALFTINGLNVIHFTFASLQCWPMCQERGTNILFMVLRKRVNIQYFEETCEYCRTDDSLECSDNMF